MGDCVCFGSFIGLAVCHEPKIPLPTELSTLCPHLSASVPGALISPALDELKRGSEGQCPALTNRRMARSLSRYPAPVPWARHWAIGGALASRVSQPVARIVPGSRMEKGAGGALQVKLKCPPVWWVRAGGLAESHPTCRMVKGPFRIQNKVQAPLRSEGSLQGGQEPCQFRPAIALADSISFSHAVGNWRSTTMADFHLECRNFQCGVAAL
jgi:hypothetical protein